MILTPMNQAAIDDPERLRASEAAIPWGRAGKPEEVADLALFLASDESAYCTGAEFLVDGGMLAGVVNPYARPTYD
jgi:glucose 1-dehydrogenase